MPGLSLDIHWISNFLGPLEMRNYVLTFLQTVSFLRDDGFETVANSWWGGSKEQCASGVLAELERINTRDLGFHTWTIGHYWDFPDLVNSYDYAYTTRLYFEMNKANLVELLQYAVYSFPSPLEFDSANMAFNTLFNQASPRKKWSHGK